MEITWSEDQSYAVRLPDFRPARFGIHACGGGLARVFRNGAAAVVSGLSRTARRFRIALAAATIGLVTANAPAQHGGGHAGGGGFSAGGGHMGGGGFPGGGFHGSPGFSAARPGGSPAFRGYAPGMRPGVPMPRYRTPTPLRGGYPYPRGNYAGGAARFTTSRPLPYGHTIEDHRNRGFNDPGRFGRYGNGGYRYHYPYRGYGFPIFPYFGFGYSPLFLPGFLGWDLDWDTLGWNDPGWDDGGNYTIGYNPGYNAYPSGYDSGYDPGYSGGYDPDAAAPQPGSAPATSGQPPYNSPPDQPGTDQPSPLLPSGAYPQVSAASAPAREQLTTLIFKDGRPPERIRDYAMTRTTLFVSGPHPEEIPLDTLDLPATEKVNRQAGVRFQLP